MLKVLTKDTQTLSTTAISGGGTAVAVNAASSFSAQGTITVNTPSAKTCLAGVASVQTANFPAKAGSTAGDYVVINDQSGGVWAAALNKGGSDPAPTGAAWVAIASANKTNVDISGASTAAQVATAVLTALNLLTGFSTVITGSDAAADGHVSFTQAVRGVTTANAVHNANDSGAGSITTVATTAGVNSAVSTTAETLTIASHGLPSGLKVQASSTSTLPAGLATSTDYFVIVSSANAIQLATSLANAQAGTAIDITGQGTSGSTITITPTSIAGCTVQLQKSNDGGTTWSNDGSATSISATASYWLENTAPAGLSMRVYFTLTAGSISASSVLVTKGNQ